MPTSACLQLACTLTVCAHKCLLAAGMHAHRARHLVDNPTILLYAKRCGCFLFKPKKTTPLCYLSRVCFCWLLPLLCAVFCLYQVPFWRHTAPTTNGRRINASIAVRNRHYLTIQTSLFTHKLEQDLNYYYMCGYHVLTLDRTASASL